MVAATMLVICSVETGSVEEATSPASGASRSSFRTRSSSRLRTPSSTPMTSTRGSTRQACMQFMSRSGWGCSTAMASNGHGRRSVAVPVGVKEHLGPVERSALLPIRQQLGQPVDPVAVDASQPPLGDRSVVVGVASRGGQQRQLAGLLFFFQAEDGIRDLYVTGVKTCALPISHDHAGQPARERALTPVTAQVPEAAQWGSHSDRSSTPDPDADPAADADPDRDGLRLPIAIPLPIACRSA